MASFGNGRSIYLLTPQLPSYTGNIDSGIGIRSEIAERVVLACIHTAEHSNGREFQRRSLLCCVNLRIARYKYSYHCIFSLFLFLHQHNNTIASDSTTLTSARSDQHTITTLNNDHAAIYHHHPPGRDHSRRRHARETTQGLWQRWRLCQRLRSGPEALLLRLHRHLCARC